MTFTPKMETENEMKDIEFNSIEMDHDRFILNMMQDAFRSHEHYVSEQKIYQRQQQIRVYGSIKENLLYLLGQWSNSLRCNNSTVKLDLTKSSTQSKIQSIREHLQYRWKFTEHNVSFMDAARCICGKNAEIEDVYVIRDLMCSRDTFEGCVSTFSDHEDLSKFPAISQAELWAVLYIFAADTKSEQIAMCFLKNNYIM